MAIHDNGAGEADKVAGHVPHDTRRISAIRSNRYNINKIVNLLFYL